MLVLRRREDEWVTITHKSGDILRIKTYAIFCGPNRVSLAFHDPNHNFQMERDEREVEQSLTQTDTVTEDK